MSKLDLDKLDELYQNSKDLQYVATTNHANDATVHVMHQFTLAFPDLRDEIKFLQTVLSRKDQQMEDYLDRLEQKDITIQMKENSLLHTRRQIAELRAELRVQAEIAKKG